MVGQPVLRRDALEKLTGKAQFAGDVRLPGMLDARILRPPAKAPSRRGYGVAWGIDAGTCV
jgi:CO/xanthine dehydrogenase Mo-binding subunit